MAGTETDDRVHGRQAPSRWRYTIVPPGSGWQSPDFDARRWGEGLSGFGTTGTPGMFIGTPWLTSDIWLRCVFQVPEAGMLHPQLRVYHNEDADVFVNGILALRVDAYTNRYHDYPLSPEAVAALRPGENVLAVHCRQTAGAQYIDVGLQDLRNIIDDDRPLLFPGVCEVNSPSGDTTVLVLDGAPAHLQEPTGCAVGVQAVISAAARTLDQQGSAGIRGG